MKTTKISFIVMLVILIASLGSTQTMAQGQGKCEQHGKEGMQGGMCKGDKNMAFIKDITPEQQKQIDALKTNLIKESINTKNLIAEKQAHLKTVSTGDNVDMAAVNKTIDELFALKADMSKKHEAFKQDVRKLLTADQKVMFDIHAGKGHGNGCQMGGMCQGSCKMDGNGQGMGHGSQGCDHMGQGAGNCKGHGDAAGCKKGEGSGCQGHKEGCKGGDGQMNGCQGHKEGCKGGDGQGKMQGCQGHGNGEGKGCNKNK